MSENFKSPHEFAKYIGNGGRVFNNASEEGYFLNSDGNLEYRIGGTVREIEVVMRDFSDFSPQNPKPPAESDEKLPAFGTLALSVERTNPLEWATAAVKAGYDLARANDPRVTKIGENVTTENVSNENVSNESDGKLRDEMIVGFLDVNGFNGLLSIVAEKGYREGWNAARANPVADPRVAELVEAEL